MTSGDSITWFTDPFTGNEVESVRDTDGLKLNATTCTRNADVLVAWLHGGSFDVVVHCLMFWWSGNAQHISMMLLKHN